MLKLVYGVSGSGKTRLLTDLIRRDVEAKKRCFLLVPEQQAYISERDLPLLLPESAGLYFEVVNFSRLAEDVFHEFGGVTHQSLSPAVRSLLMWDTLRTLSPMLTQYGKNASNDPTLSRLMLQAVNELRMNGINSETLEAAAESLDSNSALCKKMRDLALIDAMFHEKNQSVFGNDPADKLLRMADILDRHAYFTHANIYIDSFTSFTAQEYRVLALLLRQADMVTVVLCLDRPHSRLPHFESTAETAKRLEKAARDADAAVESVILSKKSGRSPALDLIERELWNFSSRQETQKTLTDAEKAAVEMFSCANIYEECEAAALHILELIHGGMLFGEIVVVVRDTDVYRGVLDAALERYGIPYFLSEPTELSARPLARLLLSALRAVARHYPVQEILTLVKTGLVPGVTMKEAAMFEEYCETWHLTGSRFCDPHWSMNPDGLTTDRSARAEEILRAANAVRAAVIKPLERLSLELHTAETLTAQCAAVYRYLEAMQIAEQMTSRAEEELAHGLRRQANETLRLYRITVEALTTLAGVLPDFKLTTEELFSALSMLFSDTELSSVPNLHDCVMIGSASMLRVENVKASLLLGLCEGEFPRALSDDGLFTESDKICMESLGLVLDSREKIRSSEELLYVYRAATKPCEHLWLSTVEMQIDGSARTPSLAFHRISALLEKKPLHFDLSALQARLQTVDPKAWTPEYHLPPASDIARTLRLSQSKIRSFVLCPFSYFSNYQLKLREKKDSRPSYADDGLFLHFIFEKVLSALIDENGSLHRPIDTELSTLVNRVVDDYIAEIYPLPVEWMDSQLLHLFARLRKLALTMLRDMLDELAAGSFVPTAFEQRIGDPINGLPAVTLELRDGSRVILDGTVDRIDVYKEDDKVYIRVIDYKSGEHRFSAADVKSGLDLQLVLYLYAACFEHPEKQIPVGASYLYAKTEKGQVNLYRSGFLSDDPTVAPHLDCTEDSKYTKKAERYTPSEIKDLMQDMQSTVESVAERILAGEAQKTPSEDACRFCSVRENCDKAYRKGGH